MRTPLLLALTTALTLGSIGCSTPEQRHQRQAERAREDARRDAEDRRQDAKYEEERWDDFLTDYAHGLGKSKSELTSAQRTEARQIYKREGSHSYGRHHYWYY